MCSRPCPRCGKIITKAEPKDDFICTNCGWHQNQK